MSDVVESLYERIGGEKFVDAALDIFYRKVILDPELSVFFSNTDIQRLVRKQKLFLIFAFGGPSEYTYWQKGLKNAHKQSVDSGLNDNHFDLVVEHLADTMKELSVAPNLIAEAKEIVEGTRKHVLGK